MNNFDNHTRCKWVNNKSQLYINYHDNEWGVPCYDDHKLFEMLTLEIFQAGLSWECVLNKRQAFSRAFDNFDVRKVALYDMKKKTELYNNKNIIRHKSKIDSAINNAEIFLNIQRIYGSFSSYIWNFTDGKIIYETGITKSSLSDKVFYDLKNKGMKFLGSTTVYSFLSAIGIINCHDRQCFMYHKHKSP